MSAAQNLGDGELSVSLRTSDIFGVNGERVRKAALLKEGAAIVAIYMLVRVYAGVRLFLAVMRRLMELRRRC
jgi:hypothetical protein